MATIYGSGWGEQYLRMKRYYRRVERLRDVEARDDPSDEHVDDIYAFFTTCYHLDDWLKNDPAVPQALKAALPGPMNTAPLSVCVDIANGLKHFERRSDRSQQDPQLGPRRFSVTVRSGMEARKGVDIEIMTANGMILASDLAANCIAAWDVFLVQQGLAIPSS